MPAISIIFTAIFIGWLAASYQIKAAASTTAARNLDRSNDGVVFHHLQTSRIATDIWHHTTLFVLPSHDNWPKRSTECPKQFPNSNSTNKDQLSLLCYRFPQVVEALNVIYGHTGAYLYGIEREIRDAIPTTLDLSDDYRRDLASGLGLVVDCLVHSGWLMKIKSSK